MEAFEGSESGPAQLRGAARRLDRLAGDHPLLAEALAGLDRAIIEADEAEAKLHEAARAMEYDPDRLEATETRLFELRAMARKHNVQPDDLAELSGTLAARLDAIEGGTTGLAKLEAAVTETAAAYTHAATALSDQRAKAATRLDVAVAGELVPLKLDAARFRDARRALARRALGAGRDGPRRISDLDQPGRALCAAGEDRVGRRTVALYPRAEGGARRRGRRRHDHIRRNRPRGRRRGRIGDWRAARAGWRARAGSCSP
jgi:DNA repair ATPase RecN